MARILLMEDDLALSAKLIRHLQGVGHAVRHCDRASAAKEELWRFPCDLLITDIIVRIDGRVVPDGGLGLIAWVRQSEKCRDIPIIAMTASYRFPGMSHILTTARQMGADVCMEKPLDIPDLAEKVFLLTGRPRDRGGLHAPVFGQSQGAHG